MKNTFKKISAIAAAAFVSAALTIPTFSFADDPAPANPWVEDSEQNGMDLISAPYFNKSLTIYNEEAVNAYIPAVKYVYAVSTPEIIEDSSITDKYGYKATVKPGVSGGLTLADAGTDGTYTFQFTKKDTAVSLATQDSSSGLYYATVTDKVKVAFDASKFTAPGVYRYAITETSPDYDQYGITRSEDIETDGSNIRYVDVYVHEDPTDGSMDVYGSVMFYKNDTSVGVESVKTDGFTEDSDPTGKIDDNKEFTPDTQLDPDPATNRGDDLYTYNYTVNKVVKNSLIEGAEFAFTVKVANSSTQTASYAQYFNYSTAVDKKTAADAIAAATTKGTVNTADPAVKLQDGEYLALTAVPANCTISVSEANGNDAVFDVVASDATAGDLIKDTENVSIDKGESAAFTEKVLTNYDADSTDAPEVALTATTFTNTMHDISITGVLFMVAPFALMIAAAGLLIFVVVRSRKRDASDNAI